MYYANRMTRVKERFNQQFFDAGRNSYGGQTANVLAIQLGLVPEGKLGELVKSLREDIHSKNFDFIQTGIFGLGRIFPSLTENGADDLAYSMLTKTGEHSFAYMWEKYHATTLWEVLPVDDSMGPEALNGRSHSHPMNAGYDEWFFRGIAGIHPDERAPGFKRIIFRPYYTSKLQYAHATYESPYGRVLSDWKWEGNSFHWEIQVPANSGAEFYFPKLFGRQQITVNGAKVESELIENIEFPGFFLYKPVGSGRYAIRITNR
jgi:alpha-L-rhamnosidase